MRKKPAATITAKDNERFRQMVFKIIKDARRESDSHLALFVERITEANRDISELRRQIRNVQSVLRSRAWKALIKASEQDDEEDYF